MSRKLSYQMDDEPNDVVKRYEQYLAGKAGGYFDVEELESIVEYYFRNGRTKDCSSVIDFGLKLHPHSDELKIKRAKIYLSVGDTSKAIRILDSITQNNEYETILLRIELYSKTGRNAEALFIAFTLIEDQEEDVDNICLDIAFIFISQFDFEHAVKFLEKGDRFYNQNIELLFELAFCYEQLRKTEDAIRIYQRIVDYEPYTSEAWFNLGQIYFNEQQFNEALTAYDFALAINDDDSLTLLQKAHTLFQLENYVEAIEAYKEYAEQSKESLSTNVFIGECYEKLELYDEAIVFYNFTLNEEPENYDALTGIGICLLEKEDYATSLKYIQKAIVVNEYASDAWVYLAEGLVGLDDLDNALLAYLKSISLDPIQPDTLMAIANIYMDKSEYKTALGYYLKAYDLDNTLEFIELFISVAFYKNKNMTSAKLYLKKAMALNLDAAKMFFEICPDADQNKFLQ
jgi:tetratricopeptide (TPR) repeat protein